MNAIRPVFVLGKHRSGTTWLANQLCAHADVAGVQHDRHFGIHESAYFERVSGRFGDLDVGTNYVEFVRVLGASDYFRLAGATEDFLYSLWPTTYEDVFRAVMDRFAEQQGATHWVEKSPGHTPRVAKLHAMYPDARFIGIVRDPMDVVRSATARSMATPGSSQEPLVRARRIARVVTSWAYYNRAMEDFARRSDTLRIVTYRRLREHNTDVLQELCNHLGLTFDARMQADAFQRDTSFGQGAARPEVLDERERRLVAEMVRALDAVPLSAFSLAERAALRVIGRRPLPTWFFRLLEAAPPERGATATARDDQSVPAGIPVHP